jgi:hypothetical protein
MSPTSALNMMLESPVRAEDQVAPRRLGRRRHSALPFCVTIGISRANENGTRRNFCAALVQVAQIGKELAGRLRRAALRLLLPIR